jgi:hypothetical protein
MATLITNIQPKEITKDVDTGYQVASFEYYEGLKFAKDNKLIQTTNFKDVFAGTHYIVCCGDVMVKVKTENYPNIERRII